MRHEPSSRDLITSRAGLRVGFRRTRCLLVGRARGPERPPPAAASPTRGVTLGRARALAFQPTEVPGADVLWARPGCHRGSCVSGLNLADLGLGLHAGSPGKREMCGHVARTLQGGSVGVSMPGDTSSRVIAAASGLAVLWASALLPALVLAALPVPRGATGLSPGALEGQWGGASDSAAGLGVPMVVGAGSRCVQGLASARPLVAAPAGCWLHQAWCRERMAGLQLRLPH